MKSFYILIVFFAYFSVAAGMPFIKPGIQPGTRTPCEVQLEDNIQFTLTGLKTQGLSPEKLAEARLYMDLLKEKYRLQVEQLIMDRTAFTISGIAGRLKAPFITYGDCADNSSIGSAPIDTAVVTAEKETPCRQRLLSEIAQTLIDLKESGFSPEVVTLAKYYMEILDQLQIINLKLVTMNRISFPLPAIQGQFQDPFVPYERCKSISILNPV